MALVVTSKVQNAYRFDNMDHGLRISQVSFAYTVAGDYGTTTGNLGFQLQANAAKFGFRKIFDVLSASVVSATNGAQGTFTFQTSRIVKLWAPLEGPTAANLGNLRLLTGAEAEVSNGVTIFTTDTIYVVLLGV